MEFVYFFLRSPKLSLSKKCKFVSASPHTVFGAIDFGANFQGFQWWDVHSSGNHSPKEPLEYERLEQMDGWMDGWIDRDGSPHYYNI